MHEVQEQKQDEQQLNAKAATSLPSPPASAPASILSYVWVWVGLARRLGGSGLTFRSSHRNASAAIGTEVKVELNTSQNLFSLSSRLLKNQAKWVWAPFFSRQWSSHGLGDSRNASESRLVTSSSCVRALIPRQSDKQVKPGDHPLLRDKVLSTRCCVAREPGLEYRNKLFKP